MPTIMERSTPDALATVSITLRPGMTRVTTNNVIKILQETLEALRENFEVPATAGEC